MLLIIYIKRHYIINNITLNRVIENRAPSIGDRALYLIALHKELYREGKILDKLSPECLEALRVLKECDNKGRLTSTKF